MESEVSQSSESAEKEIEVSEVPASYLESEPVEKEARISEVSASNSEEREPASKKANVSEVSAPTLNEAFSSYKTIKGIIVQKVTTSNSNSS